MVVQYFYYQSRTNFFLCFQDIGVSLFKRIFHHCKIKMGLALSHLVCLSTGVAAGKTATGLCAGCGGGAIAVVGAIAIQAAVGAVAVYVLYKVGEHAAPHVEKFVYETYDWANGICHVDVEDRIVCRALFEEIIAQYPHPRYARIDRRQDGQYFVPIDNWYRLKTQSGEYAFDVHVTENGKKLHIQKSHTIYITVPENLHLMVDAMYKRRAAGVEQISKYSLSENGWEFSGFAPKRRVENLKKNAIIDAIIQKCRNFRKGIINDNNGILGIFLEGQPGSGKTMMAAVVASELNLPIYNLPLDGPFLYDALLERRIAEIPQNSLIVIDEMEDKVTGLMDRAEAFLTLGGILACLDDQHIPSGCIVLATSVSSQRVALKFPPNALLREGRFGYVVEMTRE